MEGHAFLVRMHFFEKSGTFSKKDDYPKLEKEKTERDPRSSRG